MESKLNNFSEMENIFCSIDKVNTGIISFIKDFKISKLLSAFDDVKNRGFKASTLIVMMCLMRIKGLSIWAMQKMGQRELTATDENTFYRLMNNSRVPWRKILMNFALQFIKTTEAKGASTTEKRCFVIDDTDLEKTGSTIEFIGRIFNHVTRKCILGFKLLSLCYWDGKSLIVTDFSLHREKGKNGNYGISKKERANQFRKTRSDQCVSKERVKEMDMKKTEVAVSMIKRAVRKGLKASYVLMDSWFVNDYIIQSIRAIREGMMHVLGMFKIDRRKYSVNGHDMNANQIISMYQRKQGKYSRKYRSFYIPIVVDYKGEKVRLFFIKYQHLKTWTLLLTTDLTLSFVDAFELYQIRWTIEVLYKECKQYLRLGESQNTDFDGQLADATLVFITHTILTLKRRFEAYETMGGLFRESQQKLLELTLWQRILKIFAKMLQKLVGLFNCDVEDIMERLLEDKKDNELFIAIMQVIKNEVEKEEILTKSAA